MIFLDAASTTRPYKEAIDMAYKVSYYDWYNPSASYSVSHDAMMLIEDVRALIAKDINCSSEEIIFTGSACESNTQAILGVFNSYANMNFYTTHLEHASIDEIAKSLPSHCVGYIKNHNDGTIDLNYLENVLLWNYRHNIKTLVSIAYANSEIGVIQNIKTISDIVHKYNGILHVDAVQFFPWSKVDVKDLNIDLMSVSGQKFHAGRGCAFLYVKEGIDIKPIIYGSQENSLRGGTYNTAAICCMGVALKLTREHNAMHSVKKLRDKLLDELLKIENVNLNGPDIQSIQRMPNIISLTVDGVDAETLVNACDIVGEVIIGKGSACKSYEPTPSKSLIAIGLTEEQALNTIRISLDEFNTEEEIDYAAKIITDLIKARRTYVK